jgi:hypothetical protein
VQRLFQAQQGQGTHEAAGIKFKIEIRHGKKGMIGIATWTGF